METQGSHKSHVALLVLCLPEASKSSTLCPNSLRYGRQNFRGQ